MPIIIFAPYQGSAGSTGTADPSFSSVAFLMHGQGANGGTSFIDQMGNVATRVGATTTSTTQFKFGNSSLLFDGSSALSFPSNPKFAVGTGDFTFECWVYQTSRTAICSIISASAAAGGSGCVMQIDSSGGISGSTAAANLGLSGGTIPLNTWTHVAMARSAGVTKSFVNGVVGWTTSAWSGVNFSDSILHIAQFSNGSQRFSGYMQDIRLTNGVARYTTAFTPPTAPFPDQGSDASYSNVTLLMAFDSTVVDAKGAAITNTGVTVNTTTKKMGAGSGRFNGSSYVDLPASSGYDYGTDVFTIEGWFNVDSIAGTNPIFSMANRGLLFQLQGAAPVFYINGVGANWAGNAGSVTATSWNHFALVRIASGVCTFYLNGVATGSTPTHTESLGSATVISSLGRDATGGAFMTGYLDDFRITKGVARYTANFTPPTVPYPQQ